MLLEKTPGTGSAPGLRTPGSHGNVKGLEIRPPIGGKRHDAGPCSQPESTHALSRYPLDRCNRSRVPEKLRWCRTHHTTDGMVNKLRLFAVVLRGIADALYPQRIGKAILVKLGKLLLAVNG